MFILFENKRFNLYNSHNREMIASCTSREACYHLHDLLESIDTANDGPEVDIIRRELAYTE